MDEGPLVSEKIEDGKRFLKRLVEEGVTVPAACWLKESNSGNWHLYIASSLVGEDEAAMDAYRLIGSLSRQMSQPFCLDYFDVKAVEANGPLSKAVQELIRSSRGRLPIRLGSGGLAGVSIDAGYIYPPIQAAVQQE